MLGNPCWPPPHPDPSLPQARVDLCAAKEDKSAPYFKAVRKRGVTEKDKGGKNVTKKDNGDEHIVFGFGGTMLPAHKSELLVLCKGAKQKLGSRGGGA
jgi:hypothetical protein